MIDWKKVLLSDINDFNTRISNVPVLERNMFKGADLSNFDLSKAFIKSFDLSESDLTNAAVPECLLALRCGVNDITMAELPISSNSNKYLVDSNFGIQTEFGRIF